MILNGESIRDSVYSGDIRIEPFTEENLRINSYDFTLGENIYEYGEKTVFPRDMYNYDQHSLEFGDKFVFQPGRLYLGHTYESIGSSKYVPIMEGRSSLGRLGVEVHITAGFGDLGFFGNWTLEIRVTFPTELVIGSRVGQVYFLSTPSGAKEQYVGDYAYLQGPRVSHYYEQIDNGQG